MENLIRHIKEVRRKKVSLINIMNRIKKTSAAIMDNKSLTFELEQMITKGLIDQNYKILIRENQQKNHPLIKSVSHVKVVAQIKKLQLLMKAYL